MKRTFSLLLCIRFGWLPITQVVNASGRFLMSGRSDMHFHALDDRQAREIFY